MALRHELSCSVLVYKRTKTLQKHSSFAEYTLCECQNTILVWLFSCTWGTFATSIFLYVKGEGRSTPLACFTCMSPAVLYPESCHLSNQSPGSAAGGSHPRAIGTASPDCRYSATPLSHCRRRESLWVIFSNKSSPQSWPTLLPLIWTVSPLCPPPRSIPVRSSELLLHDAQASTVLTGFPGGSDGEESACRCRRAGFDPWVGRIPWRQS